MSIEKSLTANGDDNVVPFVNPNEKPWYETVNRYATNTCLNIL